MSDKPDSGDLARSDGALIDLLGTHGVDRRSLLTLLGAGTALTVGAGPVAGSHDEPHPPHIDSHFGYSAPDDEALPEKLEPDRTVALHVDLESPPLPFHFDPMGMHVDVGDIVRFDFDSPDHTVSAYHPGHGRQRRVPDDEVPFSSPMINAGGVWLYRFDHAGTYDIYCSPHQYFAMVLRLVVGDPDSSEYDDEFGEPGEGARPPLSTEELTALLEGVVDAEDLTWDHPTSADVFATDALSVDTIVENGPITRDDVVGDL